MITACTVKNDTEAVNGGWVDIIFIKENVRAPVNLPGNMFKTNNREYFFIKMLANICQEWHYVVVLALGQVMDQMSSWCSLSVLFPVIL